jgi:hypothetical protein
MGFSPVWDFHLYGIFTCMGVSPVWDFHLYEVFTCMRFSSVWGFHLYGFCVWVLRMGFAYGFSSVSFHLWVFICRFSSVNFHLWVFICGFSSVSFHLWVFICGFSSVGFHLWVFICGFHLWVFLSSGVCERSMRAKYASEVCERSNFWWDDHHTNTFAMRR